MKGGNTMATYIMLFGFTQKGIKNIKESPARIDAAKQIIRSMGAEVKQFYAVMGIGQYDTAIVLEASDDETVAKIALAIGSLGNVHTNTLRAFTEDEFRKIVAALP
jgi:uncharacterized protein with GYD domain